MKRWLAVAIVAAMLAVPVAGAASYLQPGAGPQRTGAIGFEGPQTNDTAFRLELPGVPEGTPIVEDRQAYMLTEEGDYLDGDTSNLTTDAVWRIDLDEAQAEQLFEEPEGMFTLSLLGGDPHLLLLEDAETDELVAFEIPSGEELWRTFPDPGDSRAFRAYGGAVRADGSVYVDYNAWGAVHDPDEEHFVASGQAPVDGIVAVDEATGDVRWTWNRTARDGSVQADSDVDAVTQDARTTDMRRSGSTLAADGERVYAYMHLLSEDEPGVDAELTSAESRIQKRQFELQALDAADGDELWWANDTPQQRIGTSAEGESAGAFGTTGYGCCGYPAVTESTLAIRLDQFVGINPTNGPPAIWDSPAGRMDQVNQQGTGSIGARDDVIVATSPQTVYRLERTTGDIDWRDTTTDQTFGVDPVVLQEDTAYVPTFPHGDDLFLDIGMESRDLVTGEVRWSWGYAPSTGVDDSGHNIRTQGPAFGEGLLVWGAKDGTVHVIGETEASLGEPEVPEERYTGEDRRVTLDVSGAAPGAFGEATRYMVDWGDGTVSGWQASPTFTHTYNESGEVEAQVYAGNDANQTSSTFVTMRVGEEAPTEPNWVAERFEKENQDMTFGVLGLAVALGGGAIGVARRKRKQSILQEELETLEEGFERTKENPGECEAFLDTRKARAQSLLLDGDLDEEQFGVLERRIDELHGELRTSVLDSRFEFLPHGMVQSLKKMLADGRISTWEREAIADLLDREEALTEAQKEKVRGQLDRWFAEDAGGEQR